MNIELPTSRGSRKPGLLACLALFTAWCWTSLAAAEPVAAPAAEKAPATSAASEARANPPAGGNISPAPPAGALVPGYAGTTTNGPGSPEETKTAAVPGLGELTHEGVISAGKTNGNAEAIREFQTQLEAARAQRAGGEPLSAAGLLLALLKGTAPLEIKRPALFEMALVAQDNKELVKAQQIFAQYLQLYPNDPAVPEVLLRQGLVYRQMGVNSLAISKFYAVMSTALKLKLDNMDYYRKLVLQAQIEIAESYYLDGNYAAATDFFSRLSKTESAELNRALIQYKLVRSLSYQTNHVETIARARSFLEANPDSADVPEVRFLLASALKKLGHNQDAMKQVLALLQSQSQNAARNPETWIYWQQRAGNEIANQLYKEGDHLNALAIYLSLAELDKSPGWQLPVWYQVGLIYEQLQQWQKATETYTKIVERKKDLTEAAMTPSLSSLLDMAAWRKNYIAWLTKAKSSNQAFQPGLATNAPPAMPLAPYAAAEQ